jgi:hypothetical protein
MDIANILTIAVSTLVVLVLTHVAVYYVVRTLYPPKPEIQSQPQQVFIQPAPIQIQQETVSDVVIPTYEAHIPVEAPPKEEPRRGPPPPVATSIKRESGVDSPDTRPGE